MSLLQIYTFCLILALRGLVLNLTFNVQIASTAKNKVEKQFDFYDSTHTEPYSIVPAVVIIAPINFDGSIR